MNSKIRKFSLPKRLVLKKYSDIKEVLEKGTKISAPTLNVFLEKGEEQKFAVLINKKVGNAVQRNRMKRIVREIYRKHPEWFRNHKAVFYIKRFQDDYHKLEKELAKKLQK